LIRRKGDLGKGRKGELDFSWYYDIIINQDIEEGKGRPDETSGGCATACVPFRRPGRHTPVWASAGMDAPCSMLDATKSND
jgi:hypothetical protein